MAQGHANSAQSGQACIFPLCSPLIKLLKAASYCNGLMVTVSLTDRVSVVAVVVVASHSLVHTSHRPHTHLSSPSYTPLIALIHTSHPRTLLPSHYDMYSCFVGLRRYRKLLWRVVYNGGGGLGLGYFWLTLSLG